MKRNVDKIGFDDVTPHDLRRTAATWLARLGTPRLVLEKILNHKDKTVTARYDRYQYDAEKRQALEAWARKLGEIIAAPADQTNIVQLRA